MCEEMIIRHCSPTLAGIKTGNMFSCEYTNEDELKNEIRIMNRKLKAKGLRVLPLRISPKNALIYVYRPTSLKNDLNDNTAKALLNSRGYAIARPEACVVKLIKRIEQSKDFPHEIGLFLGYPPEDVLGFIEQGARKCKFTGVWKVYTNEENAKLLFKKYKKCTEDFVLKMLQKGSTVEELAVAV